MKLINLYFLRCRAKSTWSLHHPTTNVVTITRSVGCFLKDLFTDALQRVNTLVALGFVKSQNQGPAGQEKLGQNR